MERYCKIKDFNDDYFKEVENQMKELEILPDNLKDINELIKLLNSKNVLIKDFNKINGFDLLRLFGIETNPLHKNFNNSFYKPPVIPIKECSDSELKVSVIGISKEEFEKFEDCNNDSCNRMDDIEFLKILCKETFSSDLFLFDVYQEIYFSLMHFNVSEKECLLDFDYNPESGEDFNSVWAQFRESNKYFKKNESMPLPYKLILSTSRGRKTKVNEMCVNMTRFIIVNNKFRKLFSPGGEDKYYYNNIIKVINSDKEIWKNLFVETDKILIEKIVQINLATKLYWFIREILGKESFNKVKSDITDDIINLINCLMELPNNYSRFLIIDIFKEHNPSVYTEISKRKIRIDNIKDYLKECRLIIDSIKEGLKDQFEMNVNCISYFFWKNSNGDRDKFLMDIIDYEKRLKDNYKWDSSTIYPFLENESYNYIQRQINNQEIFSEDLYGVIQKKIIENIMNL